MSNEQKLREALQAVIDSFAAIEQARQALATTEPTSKQSLQVEPAVNQQLTTEPFANDTKDAKRYRWLADSNNYYEAINLISDGSLTEDALGKAIDAAMAKGVKG